MNDNKAYNMYNVNHYLVIKVKVKLLHESNFVVLK